MGRLIPHILLASVRRTGTKDAMMLKSLRSRLVGGIQTGVSLILSFKLEVFEVVTDGIAMPWSENGCSFTITLCYHNCYSRTQFIPVPEFYFNLKQTRMAAVDPH